MAAAANVTLRSLFGITHLVTLDPTNVYLAPNIMCVKIEDDPSVDMLQHFDSTFDFIQKALDEGGKVLVHSHEGNSRSPAFVSAYRTSRTTLLPWP